MARVLPDRLTAFGRALAAALPLDDPRELGDQLRVLSLAEARPVVEGLQAAQGLPAALSRLEVAAAREHAVTTRWRAGAPIAALVIIRDGTDARIEYAIGQLVATHTLRAALWDVGIRAMLATRPNTAFQRSRAAVQGYAVPDGAGAYVATRLDMKERP